MTRKPRKLFDDDDRREEMTRAPKSSSEDAAPRIKLSTGTEGATRVDVAEDAVVRPGKAETGEPGD